MFASICRKTPALKVLAGSALLLTATACQHYAPNSRPERGSTEEITRAQVERLQERGATRTMPPSQIRIPTGIAQAPEVICRDWLNPCWEEGAAKGQAAAANVPALARVPRPAEAQTFRGVLPCDDPALQCTGQHATLTLFANQTWRAQVTYLEADGGAGEPTRLQGCWQRGLQDDRRLVLYRANGNLLGEFQASSNNTLQVLNPGDNPSSLHYTLTRQPDADLLGDAAPQAGRCATR